MPEFRCVKCDRTFRMAAHLARHTNATHGSAAKKAAARKKRGKRKAARRAKGLRGRIADAAKFALTDVSLERLGQLIGEARAEIRRRISEIQKAL
jgi:uncharacterized C2H2 Zn-finger protein